MTSDTCGPMFALPLMRYDLDSLSWRTCEATSLWDLEMSSPTFPEWGMTQGGELFELPKPERPTTVLDFSLLPTPTVQDGENNAGPSQWNRNSIPLNTLVTLLPTPTVMDMGGGRTPQEWEDWKQAMKASHNNGNGHGASLTQEALSLGGSMSQPLSAGKGSPETHLIPQLTTLTAAQDSLLSLSNG